MRVVNRIPHIAFIVTALLLWPGVSAYAGFFGPSTYEECVSKHAKNLKVSRLKPLMERSCRAKFPEAGEEDASINVDYYDCILKHLPEVDSILAISAVQSSCEKEHGPKRKYDPDAAEGAGQDQGVVLQAEQAGQYVYLEIDRDGKKVWIAGVADVKAGDTVRWSNPSLMQNYHSKSLNRTFDELYFVSRIEVIQ